MISNSKKELKNFAWNVPDAVEIVSNPCKSLEVAEQECLLNIDRYSNRVIVCCSHSNYITRLKKIPAFELTRVLFNHDFSRILEVQGFLPCRNVSFRGIAPNKQSDSLEVKE